MVGRVRACWDMGPCAEDIWACADISLLFCQDRLCLLAALAIARRGSWKGSTVLRDQSTCRLVHRRWSGEVLGSLRPMLCPSAVSTNGPRPHASFCPCRSRRTPSWCQNWAVNNPGVAWCSNWSQEVLGEHRSRWQTQGKPGGSGQCREVPRQPTSPSAAMQGAADPLEH